MEETWDDLFGVNNKKLSYDSYRLDQPALPARVRSCIVTVMTPEFCYVYFLHDDMDRKGQRCAVLARGRMNSGLVLFEDGFTAVINRWALRRAYPAPGIRRRRERVASRPPEMVRFGGVVLHPYPP